MYGGTQSMFAKLKGIVENTAELGLTKKKIGNCVGADDAYNLVQVYECRHSVSMKNA